MNRYEEKFDTFSIEYLEESKSILENWLKKSLSITETKEIINNLLNLEQGLSEIAMRLDSTTYIC